MKSVGLVILFAFLIGCIFFGKPVTSVTKTVTVQRPVYIERRIPVPVSVAVKKRAKIPVRAKVAKRSKAPVRKNMAVQSEKRVLAPVPPPQPPVATAPVYTVIPQPIQIQQGSPICVTWLPQKRCTVIALRGSYVINVTNGVIGPWTGTCRGIPRGMVITHK